MDGLPPVPTSTLDRTTRLVLGCSSSGVALVCSSSLYRQIGSSMVKSVADDASSEQVMQTLQWLRRQNFKPVPLQPASKAAISKKYAEDDYAPPSDDFWRGKNYGLGVVTGPIAGGPVDIDLDCTEAVVLAPVLLPPTPAVFGRASKRASHYLYRVDVEELDKKAFIDPLTKSTILEIRADGGHQTVMPGSIHQDTGEPIAWDALPFPDVAKVAADDLVAAARRLAISVLVARHLWMDGQRNEIAKHLSGLLYYLDWTQQDASAVVSAIMRLTGDTDKTRLLTVKSTYAKGERGGKVTGAATLRKFIGDDKLVDRILDWAGSATVNLLQAYNEQYAVVAFENKFRVADTQHPPGEPPTFYHRDDFLNLREPDTETVGDKRVPRARLWLANPRRRSYRSVDFLPGVEDAGEVLNLWTGWAVPPDPAGDCSAWYELLCEVVCGGDDESAAWMIHWFAGILRNPQDKPLTAPVIIGKQGAGKSLLLSYFGRILGPAYITVTNEEHIYGRFNRHLATALLLHSEEALYGGEKRHRGIIKSLITDEFRIFEQKGVDAKRVRNYLRLVLTSNEAHAAPAEAGDRRFTVINMGDRIVNEDLQRRLLEERDSGGPAALHHYLTQQIDYDAKLPRINIKSETLFDMQATNFTTTEAWWYRVLSIGQILPDRLAWAQRPEKDEWTEVVSSSALYVSMVDDLQGRSIRLVPGEYAWAMDLNKFVGRRLTRAQRMFDNPLGEDDPPLFKKLSNKQNAILNMPPLDECRASFQRHVGATLEWPGDDDEVRPPRPKNNF